MAALTIKIVTDSTASIPREICLALDITVVPAIIHFGSDTFMDSVDSTDQFYERLVDAPEPPTTSTPSPGAFLEAYRKAAEGATAIISIHVMETKSTLINTARLAAQMLPGVPIHVVDSQSTTLGLGLLTIAAARAARTGRAVSEILEYLERLIPRVDVFAAVPELKQLRRSGRVSLGQALVAGVLGIKPILYIGNGVAEVTDRVRGWSRAIDHMVELACQRVGDARVTLAVVHTNAEAEAHRLLEAVRHRFHSVEVLIAEAGPALASHAGPGALGIATLQVEEA